MPQFATPIFGSFFEEAFLRDEPRAALARFLEPFRGTRFETFALNNFDRFYSRFLSDLARDPSQSFLDHLGRQDPFREFRNLSPAERGERPSSFVGRVRFVGL